MNRIIAIASCALICAAALTTTSCSSSKSVSVETVVQKPSVVRNFSVRGFSEVDAGYHFNVEITTGAEYSVAVEAPEAYFQYLAVAKNGKSLDIGWNTNDNAILRQLLKKVDVTVTMPVINKATAHGQSQFTLRGTGFGDKLAFETTGQARLTIIDNIATTQLSVGTSGQSVFRCKDVTAADINAGCSGQSVANLGFVTATNVSLTTSGQSAINIATCKADALNADASGQSAINIPTSDIRSLSRSTSGQSAINL